MRFLPNIISLARLGLILPYAMLPLMYGTTTLSPLLATIIIAGDCIDGMLARRLRATTNVGTFLDSLADTSFVAASLVIFAWERDFSITMAVVLFAPRIILGLSLIIYRISHHTWKIEHLMSDKVGGVAYYFFILCALWLKIDISMSFAITSVIVYTATALTIYKRHLT